MNELGPDSGGGVVENNALKCFGYEILSVKCPVSVISVYEVSWVWNFMSV